MPRSDVYFLCFYFNVYELLTDSQIDNLTISSFVSIGIYTYDSIANHAITLSSGADHAVGGTAPHTEPSIIVKNNPPRVDEKEITIYIEHTKTPTVHRRQ